jgi:uncharacterized membrane protein
MIDKILKSEERTESKIQRDEKQLRRLHTLVDVVYALIIVRLFMMLPNPEASEVVGFDPLAIFTEGGDRFIMLIIGFILVLIYWFQSNKTTGNLMKTDGKHTVLSLLQLFFLLFYLYSVRLDLVFKSDTLALFMQSVSLALAGFMGVLAWIYATKHADLISDAVTEQEAKDIKIGILAEPLAAAFTIPFAFIGPSLWNLAWLSVLVFGWFLKKRSK